MSLETKQQPILQLDSTYFCGSLNNYPGFKLGRVLFRKKFKGEIERVIPIIIIAPLLYPYFPVLTLTTIWWGKVMRKTTFHYSNVKYDGKMY